MTSTTNIESFNDIDLFLQHYHVLRQAIYKDQPLLSQPVFSAGYFLKGLILFQDKKPVGAVCAFYNPGLKYKSERVLQAGLFECVDDFNAASLLFAELEIIARFNNLHYLIGPMNGSTWDDYRLMEDNQVPLFFTEKEQPAYYYRLFTDAGFTGISQYSSHITHRFVYDTEALLLLEQQATAAGISIRSMKLRHFEQELKNIYPLCIAAFQNNLLYTRITEKEFLQRYLPLQAIINPDFALLAEDAEGHPVALHLCLPDLYKKDSKQLIIKTIARHPDNKIKGLMAVMGNRIYREADRQNFTAIIHAFMQQDNRSNNLSVHFGGLLYRNYILYGKII